MTTATVDAGAVLIFHVEEAPEGGFTARAATESIYTEADTAEELDEAIRDAVRCHFEGRERPATVHVIETRHRTLTT